MASLIVRKLVRPLNVRLICISTALKDTHLPPPIEQTTGAERAELLAYLRGDDDPYFRKPILVSEGTSRANPVKVPSPFSKRTIACVCCPEIHHLKFMTVYEGHPTRCACGHWFELERVTPLQIEVPE